MFSKLSIFTFIVSTYSFPIGTYYGNVRVPLIAKQEVYVKIQKKFKGKIYLKGPVTTSDAFYYKNNLENIVLGNDIKKVLERHKCSIISVGYNSEYDTANVQLKIPIIGKTSLKMKKVSTFLY